jgi:class 3 adenylate cyclase/tetratricopeptide (TPR) repeat protein
LLGRLFSTGVVVSESVELATILLTDLVASTRLGNSVGPVRADQLREEHFALLRDAMTSCEGKEVKNTGDGLMVAFASASAAVRCAVSMQQLFERRYRRAEQGLHIRIGLGAGESTVKDGDYFGMPSIVAARLCAQASSDGILISAAVKMLAGRCEGVAFESAGELELKGFPEPVEAFSVAWAPLGEEASGAGGWPLPAVLRSVPPVSYVGRTEERAALEEAMTLARSGQRQVVLLSGEPGIGKTRLASYGAHQAHAEGFAVCWGACSEELAVPYEPWIEVCSHLVEHAPQELLHRHVERHGGELSRLARNLATRILELPAPQTSDPETERYLLFSAVTGLLAQVAEGVPLCIVLDDLHWADAQSLALLKHLLRTAEQGALQVIATFRDSELGKDHPLTAVLADLHSLQGVQRIALGGLGTDEVAEIMTAVAGHELDQDGVELAAQIAAETDGNPFFVGEILRGLSESGALVFDEATSRWSIDSSAGIALPESVREVIERRIERLGGESLEALRLAAVIGREFDLRLLSAVLAVEEAGLLDRVEAAMAASVLSESSEQVGRFRFVHALINQTLYEGISATRRARMHQRVAEALEELYGQDPDEHLPELALHWRLSAASVDEVKAADYACRAGQRALNSLAPAEAVRLFADAVELTANVDSPERCKALIGLGEAQLQTGDAAYRETLLEASRISSALGNAELSARAALANSRGYASVVGETDQQRLAAIERAIELDDPPNPVRRACLLALQAMELTWHPDFRRRWALADEAVSLAREAGDTRTLSIVLRLAFYAYWSAETLELRSALATELADCAAAVQDPALQWWAHVIELHVGVERGELDHALAALERAQRIAEEVGQPTLRWFSTFQTAAWQLLHGDLAAAERSAERAFQIGQEAGEPDAILIYGIQLSFVLRAQGRGQEIIAVLEQRVSASPGIVALHAGLAWTLCWLDRRVEAAAMLREAARGRFEANAAGGGVAPGTSEITALVLYADAATQTDDTETCSILYERIQPFGDQLDWNGATAWGHTRMYLGLLAGVLGKHEEADRHLAFACEFQEAHGMLLSAARAQLGWAEALAGRGDTAQAREHAARALELSREHGYDLFEERAAVLGAPKSAAEADGR